MSCKINRIAKSVAFFDEDPIRNAAICSGFSILSCVCVKGAIYFLMGRYNNETGPSCTCSLILLGYVIPFFFLHKPDRWSLAGRNRRKPSTCHSVG